MVSAAKMKRAQSLAVNSRPYTEKMYQVITSLSAKAKNQTEHWLFRDPRLNWDSKNQFSVLIVLFSTDKSLCGGLNTNLFRGLERWLNHLNPELDLPAKTSLTFVTIGRKAKEHVLRTGRTLLAEFSTMGDRPRFSDILPLSHLVSAEANSIFEALLPQYVELQLYHTLLESLASEHSARMVAMKNAHDNAIEVVDQLTLEYNQARQGRITGELLDVISSRMVLE